MPAPIHTATVALVEAGVSDPEDGWNRTYYPTGQDVANETKPWYIIDAEGQTLGRLATLVATHIRYAAGGCVFGGGVVGGVFKM